MADQVMTGSFYHIGLILKLQRQFSEVKTFTATIAELSNIAVVGPSNPEGKVGGIVFQRLPDSRRRLFAGQS